MKPQYIIFSAFIACSSLSAPLIAQETTTHTQATRLILETDLTPIENLDVSPEIHTYENNSNVKPVDSVSAKLKIAKRALKKATSLRYGKREKIRASISKSGYALTYTYKL